MPTLIETDSSDREIFEPSIGYRHHRHRQDDHSTSRMRTSSSRKGSETFDDDGNDDDNSSSDDVRNTSSSNDAETGGRSDRRHDDNRKASYDDDSNASSDGGSSGSSSESGTEHRSAGADLKDATSEAEKFDASLMKEEDLTLKNCNKYINEVTDTVPVTVHPSMLLLTLPKTTRENDEDGAIQANILDFNHNDPTRVKGYEIMNTMMGDPYETNYNLYKYNGWGPDAEVLFLNGCVIDVSSCPSTIQNAKFTSWKILKISINFIATSSFTSSTNRTPKTSTKTGPMWSTPGQLVIQVWGKHTRFG